MKKILQYIAGVCLFFITGLGLPLGYHWIVNHDALRVEHITFLDLKEIPENTLYPYVDGFLKRPLYGLLLKDVVEAVSKHPAVEFAQVFRYPPNELRIRIQERLPVGISEQGELLDKNGKAFLKLSPEIISRLQLPEIHLANRLLTCQALFAYQAAGFSLSDVKKVGFIPHKGVNFQFKKGLEVELGEEEFLKKWDRFQWILNFLGDKKLDLVYMNLRFVHKNGKAVVRFMKKSTQKV